MGLLNYLRSVTFGKGPKSDMRVLILGLDNAGKSSILRKLSDEDIMTVRPTMGFQIKVLHHGDLTLNVWDVGGQQSIRPYWRNYFDDVDCLIYVIDSADRRRMDETGLELQMLLEEERLRGVPLVIFANKQDLLSALSSAELSSGLNLHAIRDRPWQIFPTSAKDGSGLQAAMDHLAQELHARHRSPGAAVPASPSAKEQAPARID
eukprot:gene10451-7430_t